MFLDICGFTSWSSEREPSQVFQLLENVYQSFDDIAQRLKVFKVETIGDSYVAVCGLPTKCDGHAMTMVRFADSCLKAMARVTRDLEVYLGPATGDLTARGTFRFCVFLLCQIVGMNDMLIDFSLPRLSQLEFTVAQ